MNNRNDNAQGTARALHALRAAMCIAFAQWIVASPADAGKVTAP